MAGGAGASAQPPQPRLAALDILRGLVIVLMVLDHVRDFLHIDAVEFDPLDPARTTPLLFLTRWLTHFCAPTFVFLAGASARLQGLRGKPAGELSRFLLTRGAWLVVLELTVVSFGWSFSPHYLVFLQVIWAIGCSMALLGLLVGLPAGALLALGVLIIALHNLLDPLQPERLGAYANAWSALHVPRIWMHDGAPWVLLAYPVLPWFGVMLFGYGLGGVFVRAPPQRDRFLLVLGLSMTAAFVLLRLIDRYGDPQPWAVQPLAIQTVMAFLSPQKYPPSLLYVCMTLGPVIALIPLIERWTGPAARFLRVFGAVPLFAYVLHLYLAHAASIVLRLATGQSLAGQFDWMRALLTPQRQQMHGSGFPLWVVYAAWIAIVLAIYPACRAYARLKQRRRDWWLSYL
ncbi:MAG TPA: heparan-alpha-glucosaminide N-acetyltransferase domain-containing protein [Steroidobacteraceae bacterium]|nr:heparan-alpha-glucosaminide N-acetyltransferase domain-containing protein [Steroidobacteraceae bacterium]